MAPDAHQRPFAFGDWQVDPSRSLLTGDDGESVRLEPRLMDLLLLFAGSGGRVLGKNEITLVTWGDRAIGDGALAASPPLGRDPPTSDGPPEAAGLVAQGRRALASPGPASLAQARLCFEA